MHNRDNLHRTALLLIDLKRAKTVEAAYSILNQYRLTIAIGQNAANSESGQACLLTIINIAIRSCSGGVQVLGITGNEPTLTPLASSETLRESIQELGGAIVNDSHEDAPVIFIGDYDLPINSPLKIRATYGGWSGGIIPKDESFRLSEDSGFPPAAIFAGALAVSECFAYLFENKITAGSRAMGLSLYEPESDWRHPVEETLYLPESLWLLGLGHLGQAYAWALAALPYPANKKPCITLQDYDVAIKANISTSVLTQPANLEQMKTRIVSSWLEKRGFETRMIERKFTGDLRVTYSDPNDPKILLCGVDNPTARRLLENPGFQFVIDAGLGSTAGDYDGFCIQTFTNTGRAAKAFPDSTRKQSRQKRVENNQAGYDSLGHDQCGMHWAADIMVGVPFVGVATACLVISSAIRAIAGHFIYETISGSLRNIDLITAYKTDTTIRNPGYIAARLAS